MHKYNLVPVRSKRGAAAAATAAAAAGDWGALQTRRERLEGGERGKGGREEGTQLKKTHGGALRRLLAAYAVFDADIACVR